MPAPIRIALSVPISTGRPAAAVVTAPRQAKMIIAISTAASLRRVVAVTTNVPANAPSPHTGRSPFTVTRVPARVRGQ